jgi:hypothetical protein
MVDKTESAYVFTSDLTLRTAIVLTNDVKEDFKPATPFTVRAAWGGHSWTAVCENCLQVTKYQVTMLPRSVWAGLAVILSVFGPGTILIIGCTIARIDLHPSESNCPHCSEQSSAPWFECRSDRDQPAASRRLAPVIMAKVKVTQKNPSAILRKNSAGHFQE